LLKPSEYRHMGELFCSIYGIMWGRWLVENVRIPSYRGRSVKLLKKTSYDI